MSLLVCRPQQTPRALCWSPRGSCCLSLTILILVTVPVIILPVVLQLQVIHQARPATRDSLAKILFFNIYLSKQNKNISGSKSDDRVPEVREKGKKTNDLTIIL